MHLKIFFIHLDIAHKQPQQNSKALLEMIEEAAEQGADLILAPEMAVSGYSFKSRRDIAPLIEDEQGQLLKRLTALASSYGCYICIGLATRDKSTNVFYNSAITFGPEGMVCRYHKINAESRWACPGDPKQDNTFDTRWGRVGVLICSDTYHDLIPRTTALRGADLLLVPANWPPSGLDPVELWQARALENGMMIAACNRTGRDLTMDCRKGESCLIDADGKVVLRKESRKSAIFSSSIPLRDGRLQNQNRLERLADRRPDHYHPCYRNLNAITDLTSFLDLPTPGTLVVHCLVPEQRIDTVQQTCSALQHAVSDQHPSLWILPAAEYTTRQLQLLTGYAASFGVWLMTQERTNPPTCYLFGPNHEEYSWPLPAWPFDSDLHFPQVSIGPAQVAILPYPALLHPEFTVAASKRGCDLLVVSTDHFSDEHRLVGGVRTINHLAAALCSPEGAGIWMRPEGHQRWQEKLALPGQHCSFGLDTWLTRSKRFQDRIDFDRILTESPPPPELETAAAGRLQSRL